MDSPDFSRLLAVLPAIDRFGAQRIDRAVSFDSASGALLGVLLTPPLLFVARAASTAATAAHGWAAGLAGWIAGWLVTGYLALVLLANWQDLDSDADAESGAQSDSSSNEASSS